MRFENQKFNHPRQNLWNQILLLNRLNNSVVYFTITRTQEVIRLTHIPTELKFEVTIKLIGLNPHPNPTSTEVRHRTFLSLFVVTSLQFVSTDEPAVDHQWGSTTFYNPISGLKNKTIF